MNILDLTVKFILKKLMQGLNRERFIVFGLAALELTKKIGFQPDIIHCNDWHTANIPVYLKTIYRESSFYQDAAVFTVFIIWLIREIQQGYSGFCQFKHG